MGLLRRRDRVRTCTRCGEHWRVPAGMAKARRASRWQRSGLGADSHAFGSGTALFNAAIAQMTENNAARNQAADADDLEATAFDTCPNCGSGAWTEQKAPKHPAT